MAVTLGVEVDRKIMGYSKIDLTKSLILDAYRKIGLSTTENFILLPRKSVTAVIGFHQEEGIQKNIKCKECKNEKCNFRKEECYFE